MDSFAIISPICASVTTWHGICGDVYSPLYARTRLTLGNKNGPLRTVGPRGCCPAAYPEAVIRCRVQQSQASFAGNVDKAAARAAPMVFASALETAPRPHASSRTLMRCCATFLVVVEVVAMNDCNLGAVNSTEDLATPAVDETVSERPWASRMVRAGRKRHLSALRTGRPDPSLTLELRTRFALTGVCDMGVLDLFGAEEHSRAKPARPAPATPRRLLQSCPLLPIQLLFLSSSTNGARAYGERE